MFKTYKKCYTCVQTMYNVYWEKLCCFLKQKKMEIKWKIWQVRKNMTEKHRKKNSMEGPKTALMGPPTKVTMQAAPVARSSCGNYVSLGTSIGSLGRRLIFSKFTSWPVNRWLLKKYEIMKKWKRITKNWKVY